MIETWHIAISGFRQRPGQPTGMHRLWCKLGQLRSPSTVVALREWDADWAALAELITQTSVNGLGPKVFVYAYSWGAGYGLVQLARHLLEPGIHIRTAVLADPVYRSRLIALRWLALTRWGTITIPRNVDEIRWTRQDVDLPSGHELMPESPHTVVHDPFWINRGHCWMDDDPKFHGMALQVAGLGDQSKRCFHLEPKE